MKHIGLLILSLLLCHLASAQRVKIIFDTDMDSDVDDVGALAMLHGFANLGEAEILAVMVSSLNPWSPGAVDVINTYYGRPEIPIGAVQRFGVYHKSKYARRLCEEFKPAAKLGEDMPEATTLYRKILASQPDTSVVVVTVGDLTNLSKLLDMEADQFRIMPDVVNSRNFSIFYYQISRIVPHRQFDCRAIIQGDDGAHSTVDQFGPV